MALSDKWTRTQLRAAARRELMDPLGRWITDSEMNNYLSEWQHTLQMDLRLVWGSATHTNTGTATVTLASVATDFLVPEAVYWDDVRLVWRTKEELELLDREWRGYSTTTLPSVVYQDSISTVSFWPPPTGTHTVIFEYPRELTFAADTSTHEVPAWTKYSAISYACFRSYLRNGAIHDALKAGRYKAIFDDQLMRYGRCWRNYFPKRSPALRPASEYEMEMLVPYGVLGGIPAVLPSNVVVTMFEDEVPSGLINSSNVTYTLTQNPDPDDSLALFLDGVRLVQGTDYTLSGTTITVTSAPVTGQSLFAHYRYQTT